MHLSLKATDLIKAASAVQHAVGAQSSMPILANVMIEASGQQATFTANDMESYIRCTVPALSPPEAGAATVSADILSKLAKEMPEGSIVTIKSQNLSVVIEFRAEGAPKPGGVYKLAGMPPEDFPVWPELKTETAFETPQRVFKRMIERTIFSAAQADPRRVFLGELLELKDMRCRLIATDGKKLAYCQTMLGEIQGKSQNSAVIPQKVLTELSRILGNEGALKVSLADTQVGFDLEGAESKISMVSNCIDGKYPNYEAVIPRSESQKVLANSDALARILRRAGVVADDKAAPVILSLQPNLCEVSATSYDLGSFSGGIPVQYDGEKMEIAFNYRYLLDALKALGTTDVLIQIKTPSSPTLLLPPDSEESLFLIMPIKLSDIRPAYEPDDSPEPIEDSEPEEEEEENR